MGRMIGGASAPSVLFAALAVRAVVTVRITYPSSNGRPSSVMDCSTRTPTALPSAPSGCTCQRGRARGARGECAWATCRLLHRPQLADSHGGGADVPEHSLHDDGSLERRAAADLPPVLALCPHVQRPGLRGGGRARAGGGRGGWAAHPAACRSPRAPTPPLRPRCRRARGGTGAGMRRPRRSRGRRTPARRRSARPSAAPIASSRAGRRG